MHNRESDPVNRIADQGSHVVLMTGKEATKATYLAMTGWHPQQTHLIDAELVHNGQRIPELAEGTTDQVALSKILNARKILMGVPIANSAVLHEYSLAQFLQPHSPIIDLLLMDSLHDKQGTLSLYWHIWNMLQHTTWLASDVNYYDNDDLNPDNQVHKLSRILPQGLSPEEEAAWYDEKKAEAVAHFFASWQPVYNVSFAAMRGDQTVVTEPWRVATKIDRRRFTAEQVGQYFNPASNAHALSLIELLGNTQLYEVSPVSRPDQTRIVGPGVADRLIRQKTPSSRSMLNAILRNFDGKTPQTEPFKADISPEIAHLAVGLAQIV